MNINRMTPLQLVAKLTAALDRMTNEAKSGHSEATLHDVAYAASDMREVQAALDRLSQRVDAMVERVGPWL